VDDRGLIPGKGRDFSVCHHVQFGAGLHQADWYWRLFSRG
jgi:hypothetical protein